MRALLACAFLVGMSGCDSSEEGTPVDASVDTKDGGTASQEKEYCDALASRSACPSGAASCDDDGKCIYGRVMLPAATTVYSQCRAAPSCKGDDACVDEAGKAVGGAAADAYSADCVAKHGTCAGDFKADLCSQAIFAYPGAADARTCLQKPCAEVAACFADLATLKAIAACK